MWEDGFSILFAVTLSLADRTNNVSVSRSLVLSVMSLLSQITPIQPGSGGACRYTGSRQADLQEFEDILVYKVPR